MAEGEKSGRGVGVIRAIAVVQIGFVLWRSFFLSFSAGRAFVLGISLTGVPVFAYRLILGTLWVVASILLWRLSDTGRRLALGLYGWLILNLVVIGFMAFFSGPSQLLLMPSGKQVSILFFVPAAIAAWVLVFLYRRRDLFR